jgi:hypothetical protein
MRYTTRLNVLGGLAFLSFLIALRLVYVSNYGLPIRGKWGGWGDVEAPPLANAAEHRLVVFGDAWSYTGARLHDRGKGWPEWVCTSVRIALSPFLQWQHF